MAAKHDSDSKAILTELYPIVEKIMPSKTNAFKQVFARFMDKRANALFAIGPMDRIYYSEQDADDLFRSVGISRLEVKTAISKTYYWPISSFNPRYAKDEITILCMAILKYFLKKGDHNNEDLTSIYLAFSGKFYPSIHYAMFPKAEPAKYEHVMTYAINNLNNRFLIKQTGSVYGSVKTMCDTWLKAYSKEFKSFTDADIVYLIQQLHNRIKEFLKKIATEYYKAYENKDYISYDGDSLNNEETGDYHMADSDSLKAERVIERTMERINTYKVDYKFCKMSSDQNVKAEEVRIIIEGILNGGPTAVAEVKEFIRILVCTYFEQSKTKDVTDIAFITYSIGLKPNSKDKHVNRGKELVEGWLKEYSDKYMKRKKRLATKNSYWKCIYMYFTLCIHAANK